MYDIFISYRRSDRAFADALVARLEARGVSVWYDREIEGGADWREKIVDALQNSDMLAILFSEDANDSRQLKKELAVADQLEKPVVPILIEDTKPRGAYLYELADRNWLQAFPNPMEQIDKLVGLLADLAGKSPGGLGGTPAPAPAPAPVERPVPPWPDTSGAAPPAAPPAETPPQAPAAEAPAPVAPAPQKKAAPPGRGAPPPLSSYGASAPARASDYVGKQSARRRKAPSAANDILPFRWIDLVFLIPLIGGIAWLLEASGMDPGSDSDLARLLTHGLFALVTTGLYGALVFPVRYYMRRRPPLVALQKYALSSVIIYVVIMGAYLVGETMDFFPNDEPAAIALLFGAFFVVFALVAFLIYGVLSAQRALRSFRSNIKKL